MLFISTLPHPAEGKNRWPCALCRSPPLRVGPWPAGSEVMSFSHTTGVKPSPGPVELGRGADGVVVEVLDHPELVIKDMNHPFKLGRNRVALELRILHAVADATGGLGATRVFNRGTDEQERSWLVRERVFDVQPRGTQAARETLIEL